MLQDFWSVSDHFGMLYIKELSMLIVKPIETEKITWSEL